jgi:small GTP-binding protein
LGIGPNPQSPIPNPQSPIPNPQFISGKNKLKLFLKNINLIFENINYLNKKMENKKYNTININVITLGESGVGKTSIIKRYVYGTFEEETISTIGLNFGYKVITLSDNNKIKLKLVDTAGQERYRALNKNYFKNGEAVLYVFSFDKIGSFDKIKEWKQMFSENQTGEGIPSFLIRNKCDLDENDGRDSDKIHESNLEIIDDDTINKFVEENNFSKYVISSAKDDKNIKNIFQEISEIWYKSNKNIKKKQTTKVLQNTNKKEKEYQKKSRRCFLCKGDV